MGAALALTRLEIEGGVPRGHGWRFHSTMSTDMHTQKSQLTLSINSGKDSESTRGRGVE